MLKRGRAETFGRIFGRCSASTELRCTSTLHTSFWVYSLLCIVYSALQQTWHCIHVSEWMNEYWVCVCWNICFTWVEWFAVGYCWHCYWYVSVYVHASVTSTGWTWARQFTVKWEVRWHVLMFSIITLAFLANSWSIFILFVPVEREMNTLQFTYLQSWWRHNWVTWFYLQTQFKTQYI